MNLFSGCVVDKELGSGTSDVDWITVGCILSGPDKGGGAGRVSSDVHIRRYRQGHLNRVSLVLPNLSVAKALLNVSSWSVVRSL